ncbi:hypothetical protein B0T17DRAFT_55099 [Bombardia bombarda]|uniref:Uncharacterized protein n=1 Tax=Bombardia bombarda TaxID=252184 RepID=A0AA39XM28_9PEZI|nr:hypothetical protein B0T17DRAFT_55099 [Bombardia bombarda]
MEGILCIPPERGTILGRAVWKPRYVVVGGAQRDQQAQAQSTLSRIQTSRSSTFRGLLRASPDAIFLSIYKSKEDWEPIQQHAIGTITDCRVQMLSHRKQGPVLPTLVINVVPDPATDKLRKRRSSRTAGLTATKETAPTTMWFRPGDEEHSLQDWARFIQQFIQPNVPDTGPISPLTPASPTFTNPFAPRSREPSDMQHRPSSGNPNLRPAFYSKNSGQTQASRERPMTYSESQSLRSKPSDLSSYASSMNPSHMGFQNYTTMYPADLPSPAATIGEYQGEFIEGWTSAQGRASTLGSPVRGRDSIGSQIPPPIQQSMEPGSPLLPRESILDRAFQLRCIPGSEREVPGEEKLSSLARFDALMREADETRRRREAAEARVLATTRSEAMAAAAADHAALKSGWDLDDESDSDLDSGEPSFDERDENSESEGGPESRFAIPPTTGRALGYIAGRQEAVEGPQQPSRARSHSARYPQGSQQEALALSHSGSSHSMRPQTGYKNRNRPGFAQRTYSQPHLGGMMASLTSATRHTQPSSSTIMEVPANSTERSSEDGAPAAETAQAAPRLHRSLTESRVSTSSTKRLSFTEFTKRLSSTSSLLLVQSNASGSSTRGTNSDNDAQHHHHLNPRAPPSQQQQQSLPQPGGGDRDQEYWEKRCGWRGSVGVFGSAEGGFL